LIVEDVAEGKHPAAGHSPDPWLIIAVSASLSRKKSPREEVATGRSHNPVIALRDE
jgi:hypothetical protein